jgi:hypothetical protein
MNTHCLSQSWVAFWFDHIKFISFWWLYLHISSSSSRQPKDCESKEYSASASSSSQYFIWVKNSLEESIIKGKRRREWKIESFGTSFRPRKLSRRLKLYFLAAAMEMQRTTTFSAFLYYWKIELKPWEEIDTGILLLCCWNRQLNSSPKLNI